MLIYTLAAILLTALAINKQQNRGIHIALACLSATLATTMALTASQPIAG